MHAKITNATSLLIPVSSSRIASVRACAPLKQPPAVSALSGLGVVPIVYIFAYESACERWLSLLRSSVGIHMVRTAGPRASDGLRIHPSAHTRSVRARANRHGRTQDWWLGSLRTSAHATSRTRGVRGTRARVRACGVR
eukprot:6138193-Pleurochrysis_carterae.AAC.2